jgi:hypothetical protein
METTEAKASKTSKNAANGKEIERENRRNQLLSNSPQPNRHPATNSILGMINEDQVPSRYQRAIRGALEEPMSSSLPQMKYQALQGK